MRVSSHCASCPFSPSHLHERRISTCPPSPPSNPAHPKGSTSRVEYWKLMWVSKTCNFEIKWFIAALGIWCYSNMCCCSTPFGFFFSLGETQVSELLVPTWWFGFMRLSLVSDIPACQLIFWHHAPLSFSAFPSLFFYPSHFRGSLDIFPCDYK